MIKSPASQTSIFSVDDWAVPICFHQNGYIARPVRFKYDIKYNIVSYNSPRIRFIAEVFVQRSARFRFFLSILRFENIDGSEIIPYAEIAPGRIARPAGRRCLNCGSYSLPEDEFGICNAWK